MITIERLKRENEMLKDCLNEARLQIEYLHNKFQKTGSGNAVLSRIKYVLRKSDFAECEDMFEDRSDYSPN